MFVHVLVSLSSLWVGRVFPYGSMVIDTGWRKRGEGGNCFPFVNWCILGDACGCAGLL